MGYVKGRNIRENAELHKNFPVILKLDFENFFPSITVNDWNRFLYAHPIEKIERTDHRLYRQILFWGQRTKIPRCLSIGAPTSPILSNIMLYELDKRLSETAIEYGVKYTRYADDITVSGNSIEIVSNFERYIERVLRATKTPTLKLNNSKRGLYLRGQKRMVTGLIITPDKSISIGRERKRLISVILHKIKIGESDADRLNFVKGMLGFCISTEPSFVSRMRAKYGDDVIDQVLRHQPVRRMT
jgi:RNA-directed DNA polymerase